jgi:hypothetical protein
MHEIYTVTTEPVKKLVEPRGVHQVAPTPFFRSFNP